MLQESLRELRADKRIFMVDDHSSSHEMVRMILGDFFPERIRGETDSKRALDLIPDLCRDGMIDVLILDMDMPEMTGRQLTLELARRNVFIPTVVFSGGQGTLESKKFIAQVSAGNDLMQLKGVVEEEVKRNRGLAITYLPKEDAVLYPERLQAAVDAMLLARDYRLTSINAILEGGKIGSGFSIDFSQKDRHAVLSLCADMFLKNILSLHLIRDELISLLGNKVLTGDDKKKADEACKILFFDPFEFDYATLEREVVERRGWDFIAHRFLGSRGLAGMFSKIENLEEILPEEDFSRLNLSFESFVEGVKIDFFVIESEIENLFEGGFDLEFLIYNTEIDRWEYKDIKIHLGKSENILIKGSPRNLHSALELVLDNSRQSAKERGSKGEVEVNFGKISINTIDSESKEHFYRKGYKDEEEVIYIEVYDNGRGIVEDVLSAWKKRKKIISTKTGKEGKGLNLMRQFIEDFNDGTVEIKTSPKGTRIIFYFGREAK